MTPIRDVGPTVVVVLHGGWGAKIYPFDRQIAALDRHRVIVPDRTGYGRSGTIGLQPVWTSTSARRLKHWRCSTLWS